MSSCLGLLSKLCSNLTTKAPFPVYKTIIVPLFLFNCIVNLNFTRPQMGKLDSVRRRVYNMIDHHCSTTESNNIVIGNLNNLACENACIMGLYV